MSLSGWLCRCVFMSMRVSSLFFSLSPSPLPHSFRFSKESMSGERFSSSPLSSLLFSFLIPLLLSPRSLESLLSA